MQLNRPTSYVEGCPAESGGSLIKVHNSQQRPKCNKSSSGTLVLKARVAGHIEIPQTILEIGGTSGKELSGKEDRCSTEGGGVSWQAQECILRRQEDQRFLSPAVFSREPF